MKIIGPIVLYLFIIAHDSISQNQITTVCNPMDLSYRFRGEPSRREAADPTVVKFKDKYWLFASKSGGYWYSEDLVEWHFVLTDDIPTEDYAPTTIVIGDTIYMTVSSKINKTIYKTSDPHSGHWLAADSLEYAVEDPAFYMDTDHRLYLYWGCSNEKPLYAAEIDKQSFRFVSKKHEVIYQNPNLYGWEVRGDNNTEYDNKPWLEGLWMNKINNVYYLQYSAPGTIEKSYADGVYTASNPLGPFILQAHNPFAYKPEGFACGAGHGSTIKDDFGNYWHWGTISISVKHKFERRIGFYPVFIDKSGILYSITKYGDYPLIVPNKKVKSHDDLFPGWMLLSYKKNVSVSSTLNEYSADNMVDENLRSYWAALTGSDKEWAIVDLDNTYDIHAIQVNFAEQNTTINSRQEGIKHRYKIQMSTDKNQWQTIIDQSKNTTDNSHAYHQLVHMKKARYVRILNYEVPDGNLAISGLRVFGKGHGTPPQKNKRLKIERNQSDRRSVTIKWDKVKNATGYLISYGISDNRLYQHYMVYSDTTVKINSLNANQDYFFTIEAFNENGINKSGIMKHAN